jgi:hypothetical protein
LFVSAECDGIIKQCEEQLKLTENWRDATKQEIEASAHPDRGIEIFADEEEEGWRGNCLFQELFI